MKPYQQHDEVEDQGKAVPHPKAPNPHRSTARIPFTVPVSNEEYGRDAKGTIFRKFPRPVSKRAARKRRFNTYKFFRMEANGAFGTTKSNGGEAA